MKTAREMFEELGYKKLERLDFNHHIGYEKGRNYIWFHIPTKTYISNDSYNYKRDITLEEHKAIHQQLKELGWIE